MEQWKIYKITCNKGYGKKRVYEVSNLGRVKLNGALIEPHINATKYPEVASFRVHRAVAELFVPNPENKPCVDHINTDILDNRACNLRWVTYKENNNNPLTKKKYKENNTGENHPMYGRTGEKHPKSKSVVQIDPTTNEVVKVWESTREAERIGGFCHSSIGKCCKNKFNRLGNNIYKGFKWMYLEDYEKLK